tara:strand:+ start:47 stop:673 length:627 start_codon:yes stop_codon:yes gene_type:complete
MIGNYTAHKLLTNFQKFDFEGRLIKKYKPKYNLYNLINDDLKKLPDGSFGKDFYKYMNYDNSTIVDLYNLYKNKKDTEKVKRYKQDWCVVHDLQHFITGYDTSLAGEGLMFTFGMRHEFRISIIMMWIFTVINEFFKKNGLFKSKYWIKLLLESYNLSKDTQWLMEVDWKKKFTKPTKQVLQELNITKKPELWLMAKSYIKHNYKGEQ